MNSPRETSNSDSDATYCSEVETTNREGRSNSRKPNSSQDLKRLSDQVYSTKKRIANDETPINLNGYLEKIACIIPDLVSEQFSIEHLDGNKTINSMNTVNDVHGENNECKNVIIPDSVGERSSIVQPDVHKNINSMNTVDGDPGDESESKDIIIPDSVVDQYSIAQHDVNKSNYSITNLVEDIHGYKNGSEVIIISDSVGDQYSIVHHDVIINVNSNKNTMEAIHGDKNVEESEDIIIPDSVNEQYSILQHDFIKNVKANENTLGDIHEDKNVDESEDIIIPDSVNEQCSFVQLDGVKDMSSMDTAGNIQGDKNEDESEDIIQTFKKTLSFPKNSFMLESSNNPFSQNKLEKQKELQEMNYFKQNHLLNHSEPSELICKGDQHTVEMEFHSEPCRINSRSAMKAMSFHALPKKKLLEQHRLKIKMHCQAITTRIYDIKNEVSLSFIGCGPKLQKSKVMALFEEVTVLRKLLSQLFHASKRLVSHIGGKVILKSTEYSAADQTCEKLLVQLNPENFREDFTPLLEIYDSDKDGLSPSYQMENGVISPTLIGDDDIPEIMEIQEDNATSFKAKRSKNVQFRSPLTNIASHTYAEGSINSCRLGSMKEKQNVVPTLSPLKNMKRQNISINDGEKTVSVAPTKTTMLQRNATVLYSILNEKRPKILYDQIDKDANTLQEAQSIQRPHNITRTSLNDGDPFLSDDESMVVDTNSKLTSHDKMNAAMYDLDAATIQNSRDTLTTREKANPTDRTIPASKIITIQNSSSSKINRTSQPKLQHSQNNNEGSPREHINHHNNLQMIDDSPRRHNIDTAYTLKSIECHSLNNRDSSDTDITQMPTNPCNHNAVIHYGPRQTKNNVPYLMSSQVSQQRNIRETSQSTIEIQSYNETTTDSEMIIEQTTPENDLASQSLLCDAHKMNSSLQENETISKCQGKNTELNSQRTGSTYLESSINKEPHISGNINLDPISKSTTNSVTESHCIVEALEISDIDMHDLGFDGFSSDDETQMSCTQPFCESLLISTSECNNTPNHGLTSITKEDNNSTESSARASVLSLEMEHNYSSQENQGPRHCNWESSHKFQPPGWCIIFEQHKENKTLPTLPELMIAEMISPGEMVLSLKGSNVKGTLLKNAKILTSEGATFHSPMAWCSAWHDGKTVSRTLAYHRVHYNGVTLMDICQKAFKIAVREINSAEERLTEKRKREQQSEVPKVNSDAAAEIIVLHTKPSIGNNCTVNEETEGKSHQDIFMAIQSLLVHSDGAYSEENYDADIWDNHGVVPIEKFHCIDQW